MSASTGAPLFCTRRYFLSQISCEASCSGSSMAAGRLLLTADNRVEVMIVLPVRVFLLCVGLRTEYYIMCLKNKNTPDIV
jgi:hypothetical protein